MRAFFWSIIFVFCFFASSAKSETVCERRLNEVQKQSLAEFAANPANNRKFLILTKKSDAGSERFIVLASDPTLRTEADRAAREELADAFPYAVTAPKKLVTHEFLRLVYNGTIGRWTGRQYEEPFADSCSQLISVPEKKTIPNRITDGYYELSDYTFRYCLAFASIAIFVEPSLLPGISWAGSLALAANWITHPNLSPFNVARRLRYDDQVAEAIAGYFSPEIEETAPVLLAFVSDQRFNRIAQRFLSQGWAKSR